ncbi:MAG: type I-U CRISPR-associated protein Csb2 [Planctomycetota bacterium]
MELLLKTTFLNNRYHGRNEQKNLEWPPSPLRLFQALIAGSHQGVYGIINEAVRDRTLQWLENLPPPQIETAIVKKNKGLINYVPNNDDKLDHVRTAKSMDAIVMMDEAHSVIYRWDFPFTQQNNQNAVVICAMASLVTHLGQHQDTICLCGEIKETKDLINNSNMIVFHPQESKDGLFKVPISGTLNACYQRYQAFLNKKPKEDFPIPYRKVVYKPSNFINLNFPIALFKLYKIQEEKFLRFNPCYLREPAGMTRNAMISWLLENPKFQQYYGEDRTSQLICGHESRCSENPHNGHHFAFISLPSLNWNNKADGWIRRILVVGFGCKNEQDKDLFEDAVKNLNGQILHDNNCEETIGRLIQTDEKDDSILRMFIASNDKPRNIWRTVTPIILPGMIRRGRSTEQLIKRALIQSGIDSSDIDSIATFSGPIVPKTHSSRNYRVCGYLQETPRYHAEVIFKKPVIGGPLVIGRGRYSGFGLMMPFFKDPSEDL